MSRESVEAKLAEANRDYDTASRLGMAAITGLGFDAFGFVSDASDNHGISLESGVIYLMAGVVIVVMGAKSYFDSRRASSRAAALEGVLAADELQWPTSEEPKEEPKLPPSLFPHTQND